MVYFIKVKDRGFVKIGQANDPCLRLKQLQTSNPDKLELVATIDDMSEKELHELFKDKRHRGEWFLYDSTIIKFLVDGRHILDYGVDLKFMCVNTNCKKHMKMQITIPSNRFMKMDDHCECDECGTIMIPNFYIGNMVQFNEAPYNMNVHVKYLMKGYSGYHAVRVNRNVKWLYVNKPPLLAQNPH